MSLCDPNVSWVEVHEVKKAGKEEVFDLTVHKTEAFIANGLVVHNCRGIPADLITIDEIQDILVEHIPVIEECAAHSHWKIFFYSGTPKSLDNTIEYYWMNFSTQNEWVVPCKRHGTPKDPRSWHWNILGKKNIGKKGLVCDKCFKPIDPSVPEAQWASFNKKTPQNENKVTFEGYRIPQLMVPWIYKTEKGWKGLLEKVESYGPQRLNNEVLGFSYDSGSRPISQARLKLCCHPELLLGDYEYLRGITQGLDVFAGIDHGTGERASFTVISLGAYLWGGNFTIFWIHRFVGDDLEIPRQLDSICRILTHFQVQICGCDYGGGFDRNDHLIRHFGPERVVKYQYIGNSKKGKVYWEPKLARFMMHRSEMMNALFQMMIRRNITLPCWEDFSVPYGEDILNIYSEYNRQLRMNVYNHVPDKADDSFHSILYCLMASMIKYPRPDILMPIKNDGLE
jgi:hypothetical protein